jgi:hypothetical protein
LLHSSIAKQEYISSCDACTEAMWLCKMVSRLFNQVLDSTVIYYDKQSCVKISDNPMFHESSKHIEIEYYFIIIESKGEKWFSSISS